MIYKFLDKTSQAQVKQLFTSAFSASEGDEEGVLVGELAQKLTLGIDNQEIIGVGVYRDESILASIFLTRLHFKIPTRIYMLAPVVVSTECQRMGIGEALINYGLSELRRRSVSIVITYGDPAYYSKLGFKALSENIIQAPLGLSMPEGWLGQSLTEDEIQAIDGRPVCVAAFNNPAYW